MSQKKYVSLSKLSTFLDNLYDKFASLGHKHTLDDITNYAVDSQLSSTSTNPVQNKVVDAEFEAISVAMNALESAIDGKSDTSHNHDDKYYTETEIDTKLASKSDTTHKHDGVYDAKGAADSALASAKTYADNAANTVKNDLLNGAGGAYDTLKELGDLIDDNKDAIDALETVASGKADKVHGHAIADITNLQTTLDGKAATSHGTHVEYSTTAPVMDGTAAVGSASTVARSDHKHPTDTSRAAKTDFDSHTGNTTAHITATERTNWGAAYTHSQAAHAPSNAEKNQNAFSNIAVSGQTTVTADAATDTVTFAGSNVTITTDATNDKVTFTVVDGSTSSKGVVQLTNSTSSTSVTTAATPNSVKTAYDLANTTKTNLEAEIERATVAEAQHKEDTTWKIIYDSKAITSNVNAFYNINVDGYKKLKVAIKCVNSTNSAGTLAGEISFKGISEVNYYFFNLFPNLFTKSSNISSAMVEFTMVDGYIFCDNVLRSTTAENMLSNMEGHGVWNMTNLGGGIMTCFDPLVTMNITAANDETQYYFGAGSRVMVWGCKE